MIEHQQLAVIGDVHGAADQLAAAIASMILNERRVVLLGDYIDRGPDSRGVLEHLVALKASRRVGDVVLLRGNHEAALLDWIEGRSSPARFLANRGAATVRSYISYPEPTVLEDFRACFPPEHLELLRSTDLYVEGPDLLIAHAGYNILRPDGRLASDLLGASSWRELVGATNRPRSLVVAGHYVQRSGAPFSTDGLIGLDTGCGTVPGLPLSVLLLPERTFHAF